MPPITDTHILLYFKFKSLTICPSRKFSNSRGCCPNSTLLWQAGVHASLGTASALGGPFSLNASLALSVSTEPSVRHHKYSFHQSVSVRCSVISRHKSQLILFSLIFYKVSYLISSKKAGNNWKSKPHHTFITSKLTMRMVRKIGTALKEPSVIQGYS